MSKVLRFTMKAPDWLLTTESIVTIACIITVLLKTQSVARHYLGALNYTSDPLNI